MQRIVWIIQEVRWFFVRVIHVLTKKYFVSNTHYGQISLLDEREGNQHLRDALDKGVPFACARFGFVEMDLMIRCQKDRMFSMHSFSNKKILQDTFQIPKEDIYKGIQQYDELMRNACKSIDVFGVWKELAMGDVYINTLPDIDSKVAISALSVEPYLYEQPWSAALKGKKVLVVSPFSKEIRSQYINNREHIFANINILPDFDLETMDSVWYMSGNKDTRFGSWFEAYEYMKDEIRKRQFDVALLGCGPFGFPLTAEIKKMGKQAIQLGGAIQILFGIGGKRWDSKSISRLYNDYWIRPNANEIPQNAEILDNKCYW